MVMDMTFFPLVSRLLHHGVCCLATKRRDLASMSELRTRGELCEQAPTSFDAPSLVEIFTLNVA